MQIIGWGCIVLHRTMASSDASSSRPSGSTDRLIEVDPEIRLVSSVSDKFSAERGREGERERRKLQ